MTARKYAEAPATKPGHDGVDEAFAKVIEQVNADENTPPHTRAQFAKVLTACYLPFLHHQQDLKDMEGEEQMLHLNDFHNIALSLVVSIMRQTVEFAQEVNADNEALIQCCAFAANEFSEAMKEAAIEVGRKDPIAMMKAAGLGRAHPTQQ